jgi:hypothetical protein
MGLFQAFAPSAKFSGVGSRIGGQIVDARMVQTVDFKSKRPEFWEDKAKTFSPFGPDGTPNEPKAQLEVTVETGEPDEQGETERRLFIKNKRQFDALKAALRKSRAGRRGVQIGGSIWMTLTGKEATPDGQDANTWEIEYEPPAVNAAFSEIDDAVHLFGGGTWRRNQQATRNAGTPSRVVVDGAELPISRAASPAAAATASLGIRDTPVSDDEIPF